MTLHRTCDNCGIDVRNEYWMQVSLGGRDGDILSTGESRSARDYCVPCLDALAKQDWEKLIERRKERAE